MDTGVILTGELVPAARHGVELADRETVARWPILVASFLAGYALGTRTGYYRDIADWTEWCNERGLAPLDARRAHVDLWTRHLSEQLELAQATVARKLSAVSGVYKYAVIDGDLDASPVEHVRRPKVSDESQTLGLSRTEAATLYATARTDGTRSAALIAVLLFNGLRISEALSIHVEGLRQEQGHTVTGIVRKGGKKATVPFSPVVKAAFETHLDGRSEGPVIDGLDRHTAYALVKRLARRAGLDVTPHGLRHTFVTLSLEAGIPLEVVQDACGHVDPRTTQRYNRARNRLDKHPTYQLASFIDVNAPAPEPTL